MASFKKIPANNKQGYKWICTLEGPADLITGKRKQIVRRADSQKEALARAQAEYNKLTKGIDTKKIKKLTFQEVANEWLRDYSKGSVKGSVKEGSVIARISQINLLKKYFQKQLIVKITHRIYQNFLNALDDEGYLYNTLVGVNNVASMIFKYAIKHKYMTENPASGVVIPQKKVTVEEIENKDQLIEEKYLNRSELTNFLTVVTEHGLLQEKEVFYLMAFSGLRVGELCALKWTDIDFSSNTIRITKTLLGTNRKKYRLDTPKTKKSIRVVPIDSDVMAMLKNHKIKQAQRRINELKSCPGYHDKDFVFRNSEGLPYVTSSIRSRMRSLLKKTEIKKHATPHIFRHTYVSMLAEAGVDLITTMNRVGHENEKTTLNVYTHVTKKMQKDADQKLKNHYADILNPGVLQET
ncbi:MAG: tyrosine-type recombinase/integrase [Bacillota bacterium]